LLLEMALTSQTTGRQNPGEQGNSGLDLPHGSGESNLGSTSYPRRTVKTWFHSLGADGFTLASATASQPRRAQELADLLAKPSRGHCGYGLLHRSDAYLWRPLLLFRHRP